MSVVVNSTGGMQYRALSSKQFSHKGLRVGLITFTDSRAISCSRYPIINSAPLLQYPLPVPKSGRHVHNPILTPDQQVTYRERRRRENKVDPLDLDYVAMSSPFAVHDVTSRGARLAMSAGGRGKGGYYQRNPNSVRPKGQRKK